MGGEPVVGGRAIPVLERFPTDLHHRPAPEGLLHEDTDWPETASARRPACTRRSAAVDPALRRRCTHAVYP
ncbi:hypothetical protein SPHINGO8AM_70148 [Sphingomonas sp. 8AM]|nr:hypothetical protein SPHINGO8AM_70148 [Sphingomonas sp. 8AM]